MPRGLLAACGTATHANTQNRETTSANGPPNQTQRNQPQDPMKPLEQPKLQLSKIDKSAPFKYYI